MLLYYLFWMFNRHLYPILYFFGTNLLTEGPVQFFVFFFYFRVLQKRNTKQNQTFAMIFLGPKANQKTWRWSRRRNEETTRQEGTPRGVRAPHLMAPMELHRRISFAYIYSYTLKTLGGAMKPLFHRCNLLYLWDPILGPFSTICRRGIRSRRASTHKASPMMCE